MTDPRSPGCVKSSEALIWAYNGKCPSAFLVLKVQPAPSSWVSSLPFFPQQLPTILASWFFVVFHYRHLVAGWGMVFFLYKKPLFAMFPIIQFTVTCHTSNSLGPKISFLKSFSSHDHFFFFAVLTDRHILASNISPNKIHFISTHIFSSIYPPSMFSMFVNINWKTAPPNSGNCKSWKVAAFQFRCAFKWSNNQTESNFCYIPDS